jgi:hypothetical protein
MGSENENSTKGNITQMDVLSLAAREKNLDVVMKIAPETPRFVVGDEKRIRQVLLNLMV